jgi:tripartite-type tricarboxylate transporter receptor subunit TctC
MKLKTFLIISAIAATMSVAPFVSAETPDEQGYGWHGRHGRHGQFLANLSSDERAKLRAAHQKAMADPALQAAKDRARQARQELREARRAAMLRADPTIQPILDKISARPERGS